VNLQHPARSRATAISLCAASRQGPRRLDIFMNRDLRFALSQEPEANAPRSAPRPGRGPTRFFTDLLEGETDLLELIAALDASILDDETLADGAKTALDKLQTRRRTAEKRSELKRRRLAHTLQQIGLKTLRTSATMLTLADARLATTC
jgi:hypothetical protein